MKMFKSLLTGALSTLMLLIFSSSAFAQSADQMSDGPYAASVTIDGETTHVSSAEVERLAKLNNVDPFKLKEAIEAGVDEEGRYSPFSKVPQLENGVSQEQLAEYNKQKLSSTGVPLIRYETENAETGLSTEVTNQSRTHLDDIEQGTKQQKIIEWFWGLVPFIGEQAATIISEKVVASVSNE
ncbi:hypothetical protein [Aureibacillus halotolerans]|uniref:Uncharacterized protein n=1 Tax=Aureibacillus halotolerans TaxID=1508390 RepID=A0A4R6TU41_9BACI|nr:hypothetical protein [Aureibacillus halotolerans]TDQ33449.1 hypothetical protein EV213_13123 [Aureibacillus halotolerans]